MGRADFDLQAVVRPNIWSLKPYRCARDDYSEGILLDANENSLGPTVRTENYLNLSKTARPQTANGSTKAPGVISDPDTHLERYPDPHQGEAKRALAALRNVPSEDAFFLGVGSDEGIDMVIRVFCAPAREKILICPPTYGMYSVAAQVNDVEVIKVPLDVEDGRFQLRTNEVKKALESDPTIRVVFLCSPGNPTGTLLSKKDIESLLEFDGFKGVIVVDEAYIDFCEDEPGFGSVAPWVAKYPNLIVLQTLSKSFGLAGLRFGISISSPEIAAIFNKTKAPYNVSTPASLIARAALSPEGVQDMKQKVALIRAERAHLIENVLKLDGVARILGRNDGNFVMVQLVDRAGKPSNAIATAVYKDLAESRGVVVRFRGSEIGCEGCIRITVGTPAENVHLADQLAASLAMHRL